MKSPEKSSTTFQGDGAGGGFGITTLTRCRRTALAILRDKHGYALTPFSASELISALARKSDRAGRKAVAEEALGQSLQPLDQSVGALRRQVERCNDVHSAIEGIFDGLFDESQ